MVHSGSIRPLPLPLGLGVLASFLGIGAMVGFMAGAGRLMAEVGLRGLLVLAEAALIAPALLILALGRRSWRDTLALAPLSTAVALVCALLGAALWLASLGLLELQYTLWRPSLEYIDGFRRLHELLRPKGPVDAVISLLAIAVMPALCEEAVVRGILLPSLRTRMPALLAVVLSSLVFALMHDAYRMPFTFAVGLVLGGLRLRTGSLAPSLIAHATLNALTFAAAPFLDAPTHPLPDPRPWLGAALLLTGCALSAYLVRKLPSSLTATASAP